MNYERGRWSGDEQSGLWLEVLTSAPDPELRWRDIGLVNWNKSRTLYYAREQGFAGAVIAQERSLDAAKEALVRWSGASVVAPLGVPCPHCGARRVQQEDGINWECPNSLCRRRRRLDERQRKTA